MKKIMLILMATAATLFVGCSKEKDDEAINRGFSYSVSIGDWTQPVLDGVSVITTEPGKYNMKVGDIRQVSVTPKDSSPEPESISVSFSNDCFSWDSEKKTVKAEKTGSGIITVKFSVNNHERNAPFYVKISD